MTDSNTPYLDSRFADHIFTIVIDAPIQQVWDEITKTGRIQRAMVNTVLEGPLSVGSKLRYYSSNRKRVFVVGEVVEFSPPNRFSHTFMFTMRPELPSLVTWELKEIGNSCEVTLIHGGWSDQVTTHQNVVKGWWDILVLLKREVETGTIPLRARVNYAIMGTMQFLLPKTTKVEEVDRAGW